MANTENIILFPSWKGTVTSLFVLLCMIYCCSVLRYFLCDRKDYTESQDVLLCKTYT